LNGALFNQKHSTPWVSALSPPLAELLRLLLCLCVVFACVLRRVHFVFPLYFHLSIALCCCSPASHSSLFFVACAQDFVGRDRSIVSQEPPTYRHALPFLSTFLAAGTHSIRVDFYEAAPAGVEQKWMPILFRETATFSTTGA
jgi:hypothetical protein